MPEDVDDNAGHRARLRARLIEGGSDALQDYEVLEMLLTLTIPRIDTKPTAKALIREFGSISKVFAASPNALMRVKGLGERSIAAVKIVHASCLWMLRDQAKQAPILASWQSLLDYLRADMAHNLNERVRVLHLDSKNTLIRDEIMSEGTIDSAAIHPRQVIGRAMELGTASIILVHNHPSGDTAPSRADIHLTRDIVDAGRKLGVEVHDHVIIGSEGHSSMRALGLL